MTPGDHKRVRYLGKTRMAVLGAELAQTIEIGSMKAEGIETYLDGVCDGLRDMLLALLAPQQAYDMLQRRADEASRHIAEAR